MILRRLTMHVKDQNWFAVGLDFVIVVVGVGVALMAQQWITDRQQRADMRVAEAALQIDLFSNYRNATERLAVAACRKEAYQAIAAQLLESGETWTGMPRVDETQATGRALPNLLRSPKRIWGSRNWTAGLARGTFNQMDDERRVALDSVFKQTVYVEETQSDVETLQGRMKTLAVTTTISPDDRLRYYDMLGELDDKSAIMETGSGQIIEQIEEIGIDLSAEIRTKALERLPRFNARGTSTYGDCFVPTDWPVLDKRVNKADSPKADSAPVPTPSA